MTVYGEFLFLENFITGIIITYITGQFIGIVDKKRGSRWFSIKARYVYVGILCGGYSFLIFIELSAVLAFASKIAFALLCTFIAFLPGKFKVAIKEGAVFLIVSFLMGGMTIGLLYLFKGTGFTGNGAVYLDGINYMNITLGVTATMLVGVYLKRFFLEKADRQNLRYEVTMTFLEKEYHLRAMIDTGNHLKDPISKHRVHLIRDCQASRQISADLEENPEKQRVIPYRTVGKKGIIKAFLTDEMMIFNDQRRIILKNQLIGISHEDFYQRGCFEYDILLNAQMMELEEKRKMG